MNGPIRRLVRDKGFGFVGDGTGTEYFFHRSACNGISFDQLREGQTVSFDAARGEKRPRAENLHATAE